MSHCGYSLAFLKEHIHFLIWQVVSMKAKKAKNSGNKPICNIKASIVISSTFSLAHYK